MASISKTQPKYLTLQAQLERQIRDGVLPHGSRLPSEEELCKQFGVSRGTVRAAFKGLTDEGLCTRRRGDGTYVNLRSNTGGSKGTSTVYVVMRPSSHQSMLHPFHEGVLQGIQDELADQIRLHCVPLCGVAAIEAFADEFRGAAGIIASSGLPLEYLEKLLACNENLTTCQYRYHDLAASSATIDNRHAGYLASSHLLRQGARRILFVNIENTSTEFTERQAGAQQAVQDAGDDGIQFRLHHFERTGSPDFERFNAELQAFQPDGIIACKDALAVEIMGHLLEDHQRSGKVRLIGFDDLFISSLLKPSLSTISQPAYQLGVQAARLCLRSHHNGEKQHYVMKPSLVIRESTQDGV